MRYTFRFLSYANACKLSRVRPHAGKPSPKNPYFTHEHAGGKNVLSSGYRPILLTLAPFYPPANIKSQQEMVAFVWRFQKIQRKETLVVGGNISFRGRQESFCSG